MPRLSEDQRAAILADGARFVGEELGHVRIGERFGCDVSEEHVMWALRIVARLDGVAEDVTADAVDRYGRCPHPCCAEYRALAKALEEVGR